MKRLGRLAGHRQRGIAIIIVLLITTMLTVLILDLHQSVRINFYIATNLIDGVKASYLVRSGIDVGAGVTLRDIQNNNGVDYWGQEWYDFLGKAGVPAIPISETESLIMYINDESGRLNLNNLIDKKGKPVQANVDVFSQLLNNLGLDPTLANAVVDYISVGTDTLDGSGAKDSVYGYSSMTPPATAKCSRFESLQEVRMVTGVTDDVWAQLEPLVTIYGDPKMNLNTTDVNIIRAVIQAAEPGADPSLADKIDQWRQQNGGSGSSGSSSSSSGSMNFGQSDSDNYFTAKNMGKQLQTLGMDAKVSGRFQKYFGVSSHFFRVTCTAIVNAVQKNGMGVIYVTPQKASVIYYRVAPGIAPAGSSNGETSPNPGSSNPLSSGQNAFSSGANGGGRGNSYSTSR
jgi:general secretion pathway protein K